jgi:catechol 2,3-dioxygenase-like lactoylglutathione lyase family enzyme
MEFKLDHIGWITKDLDKFEYFWCRGLGFKKVWEANIMPEKVKQLFGIEAATRAMRYEKDGMIVEIHVFDPPMFDYSDNPFDRFGINHIGLWVEDRERFIEDLKAKVYVEVKRYYDPSGWWNIFIRDLEGNWIELRTTL